LDKWCGKGSRSKKVPEMIKRAPENIVRTFLEGLVEGDGCLFTSQKNRKRSGIKTFVLTTSSKRLACGVQELLYKIGVHGRVSWHGPPKRPSKLFGREIQGGDSYQVWWSWRSWNNKNDKAGRVPFGRARFIGNKVYLPVTKVSTESVVSIPVYNIHTEDETYGVPYVVHNCKYALEHVNYRKVPAFLKEVRRILKVGGRVVLLIPNTEAQIKWILEHPEGWDGRDFFNSASGKLFGDLDYEANSHKAYFNPTVITELLLAAGFGNILVIPFGERQTDLLVEAVATAQAPSVAADIKDALSEAINTELVALALDVKEIRELFQQELEVMRHRLAVLEKDVSNKANIHHIHPENIVFGTGTE
jgi:SAM-dependent methyltransferase